MAIDEASVVLEERTDQRLYLSCSSILQFLTGP